MASFEKIPPQTTASAVGLLRKLARDEQKKLAQLRAAGGSANDIAAAETRVRDLTAKLSAAASAGGGAATEHYVHLGCFESAALERKGLNRRPEGRMAGAAASHGRAADAVLRCSLGCARFAYFAVGRAHLVGGPCLCGDLPIVHWRRDAEGIDGLRAKGLRSLT